MFRVAIDTGGTFTDIVALKETGESVMIKTPTNHHDPAQGIIEGLQALASRWNLGLEAFLGKTEEIVHGTTLALNALLEEKGAPTALLTTEGFRDAIEIRRSRRDSQWDLRAPIPPVLVPRRRRIGIRERLDYRGEVVTPLDTAQVQRVAALLKEWGIKSVAISFLFSFREGRHEEKTAEELRRLYPDCFITLSSEVAPRVGEYERTSTTVLNAYLTPVLADYLNRLEEKLAVFGWDRSIDLVVNSGGIIDALQVKNAAVKTLMSGPAGGAKGGQSLSAIIGIKNLVLADMGGTSFDVSLIIDGESRLTSVKEVEGYPVTLPMIDIHSIGAGGGSIACVDESGRLTIGPRSAGANPGPACYGLGGKEPTVTDAILLLGMLNPDNFLGGQLTLDKEKAEEAIRKYIALPLGLPVREAALAIFQVAAAKMADAVRLLTVREGYDPRGFAIVAAGGAFPIFAATIAEELEMPEVIIPLQGPLFCAWGMLGATCQQDLVRSCLMPQEEWNSEKICELLEQMREQGIGEMKRQNLNAGEWEEDITLEMKYSGQHHLIDVAISLVDEVSLLDRESGTGSQVFQSITDSFHQRHLELYGYAEEDKPWEIVNLRLTIREKPRDIFMPVADWGQGSLSSGVREIFMDSGGAQQAKVYKGSDIPDRIMGPALIDFPYTTVVVPEGFVAAGKGGYIALTRGVKVE